MNQAKPVKVTLDTKKRRGKSVTIIDPILHNPQVIETLARELRQKCGAGGTFYAKTIEIQGDHVQKIKKLLKEKGFAVV